ncbi:hypothetical protein FW774_05590 [Pedobacter sp. BS3]|uniref:THUMP-like domain-containing protein n=1 Tax=Pedobacter sp. BS3 TaxID=2567937 RepID=UPI0011EFDC9D|nr:class I SAM-dependent methyltransferase [Pedobacter sp. BS3]TZF84465.1 hypothetical protein FW774_05590 [Pedobacter sp. BS3]
MNNLILQPEVQEYINSHLHADEHQIALAKSPFAGISAAELAGQVAAKKRAEKKLPLWFSTPGIYYPAKLSIEQCSSQLTAQYKSGLLKGKEVIDCTGGFGVDSFYFSKVAEKVIHCELNEDLSVIARHNANILGASNIRFLTEDSFTWLSRHNDTFGTIYIDPSRRVNTQKVFRLSDCQPDVPANLDMLLRRSQRILVKTSPLLDIQAGLRELKCVSAIHIVSVKNDCKELLWVIDRDFTGEPEITCMLLTDTQQQQFSFYLSDERNTQIEAYSNPLTYLYEPDVALLKAGCFKSISKQFQISKLQINSHLYTSDNLIPDFPGRIFRIQQIQTYKDFTKAPLTKANIIVRNFPLTTEQLKKKHKLTDGGEQYLLFTTAPNGQMVIAAERLN